MNMYFIDVSIMFLHIDFLCYQYEHQSMAVGPLVSAHAQTAVCAVQYILNMCDIQYVHTEFITGPADTEACCLERELCSSYNSTCSIAGGKASRIDFASTRAVTLFANDTVFLDDCCYNYEYEVETGWLGKRCAAGKSIETEEECDIAKATMSRIRPCLSIDDYGCYIQDGQNVKTMSLTENAWGTYNGAQWDRCSVYEHIGSGGTYRDVCRK